MPEHGADALPLRVLRESRANAQGQARGRRAASPGGFPALRFAAATWWVVAFAGHLVFGAYILGTYGFGALQAETSTWNQLIPFGHVAGAPLGNGVVAIHVLLAAIVALCGPLQLIPALRRHAPWLHRWNGRIYATTAIIVGLAGLAMIGNGRILGGHWIAVSTSINGALLLACAVLAWRRARARDFVAHRRWALRTFLLAAGVWFFRIGMAAWIAINDGIVGFDPRTMQGPALTALSIGEWVVPLLVLEAYLRAERAHAAGGRYVVAALLLGMTAVTGYGAYLASRGTWLRLLHVV